MILFCAFSIFFLPEKIEEKRQRNVILRNSFRQAADMEPRSDLHFQWKWALPLVYVLQNCAWAIFCN